MLNKDEDFEVKDSIVVSLIIGGVFFAMVISAVTYNIKSASFEKILLFALVPAILFIARALRRKPVIVINTNGIFYSGQLVTDWPHFYNAEAIQLPLSVGLRNNSWSDRVVLKVEYCKDEDDLYRQELSLTNTQNKSEEEIVAAIEFFYELYKKSSGVNQ